MIIITENTIRCGCGNFLNNAEAHGMSDKFRVFTEYDPSAEVYARRKVKCNQCGVEEYI